MKTLNPDTLNNIQLLSLIISGKNAQEKADYILKNSSFDKLLETQPEELFNFYNLSPLQVRNIECFKSFRKRVLIKKELNQIKCSQDVKNLLLPYFIDLQHEEFYCIYLNRANKIIKTEQVSKGGISGTVTDVRIIFKNAILNTASGIIIAHNHPSGNLNPSESDTRITQKIKDAGNLLDVQLLDHLIIANEDYYSFADNGLL